MSGHQPFTPTEKKPGHLVIDARETRRVDLSGCEIGTGHGVVANDDDPATETLVDRIERILSHPVIDAAGVFGAIVTAALFLALVWS